ncbi:MAG: dynamin family protein [Actinomycetota bacterium]|nr:dynamin family protein [Actinomycetota bacterium]
MSDSTHPDLSTVLHRLSDELRAVRLELAVPHVEDARRLRAQVVDQIDDYLLPRLAQMDAPLLMVVGGSTGAGKSTLVNSLLGEQVTPAGVLRPTTRAPVLACNPADLEWFSSDRILPGLSRTVGAGAGPEGLQLAPVESLPAGLALLDSPDIDSVEEVNRELSRQLLAAADAWLFVTTAARYADAVPWELLNAARDRGTALSVVLDRVPADAGEVAGHLRQMLVDRGLPETQLLVVPEATLDDGLLPATALAPVREWLDSLAADAQSRAELVRRTLSGALKILPDRVRELEHIVFEQISASEQLEADVERAYAAGVEEVDEAVRNGSVLRGEVLARWHDVVGTGDFMRAMESRIGWLRDRARALFSAGPQPERQLQTAVESSVDALVHSAADRAAERAALSWRQRPAGRELLEGAQRMDAASPDLMEKTRAAVREWQSFVFDLVSREGADKRTTARVASLGVNGAGLVVMLAVFVQTGGLTGAEVVVAGGTSAVGQRVLEAIFGDQAVRSLAEQARKDLLERVTALLDEEAERFSRRLEPVAPAPGAADDLRQLVRELESVA